MTSIRPTRLYLQRTLELRWTDFESHVKQALARCLPTDREQYDHVVVFIMTWKHCDFDPTPSTNRLKKIFKDKYKFSVEEYLLDGDVQNPNYIPPYEPLYIMQKDLQCRLTNRLHEFTSKHDPARNKNRKTLFIYYYSGHGTPDEKSDGMLWYARGKYTRLCVDWRCESMAATRLGESVDNLLLLDCCAAAVSNTKTWCETLAACGVDSGITASDENSFTNILCDQLEEYISKKEPRTVANIMAALCNDYSNKGVEVSPCYFPDIEFKSSVVLAPPSAKAIRIRDLTKGNLRDVPNRVIITANFQGKVSDVPEKSKWVEWLTENMPPNLRDIDIKAVTDTGSDSYVVLLNLPIDIWTCLPDNEAYIFIKHNPGCLQNRPGPGGKIIQHKR